MRWRLRKLRCAFCAMVITLTLSLTHAVWAQNDVWTNTTGGKWETASNWSPAIAPSVSFSSIYVSNATTKTVTIDATTSGSFPSTMDINNLIVSGPAGTVNTLFLDNAGLATPLTLNGQLTVGAGGVLSITNSLVELTSPGFVDNGIVLLNTGDVINTNSTGLFIGDAGTGTFTVSNGTVLSSLVDLGVTTGDRGTMTIAGGQFTSITNVNVGNAAGSVGTLWVTGGQLNVSNFNSQGTYALTVGASGAGRMIQSNGIVNLGNFNVGLNAGGAGTLTVAGGTLNMVGGGPYADQFTIGNSAGSTGTVWVTGPSAYINASPVNTLVGWDGGNGSLIISNGQMVCSAIYVSDQAGSTGTVTVAGGTLSSAYLLLGLQANGTLTLSGGTAAISELTLGRAAFVGIAGATGIVSVTGGTLSSSLISIGDNGGGIMGVSNGNVSTYQMFVAGFESTNCYGSLALSGGTFTVGAGGMTVGMNAGSTGIVTVTGGTFIDNTGTTTIGQTGSFGQGIGEFVVSNGFAALGTVSVWPGSTFTMSGGGVVISNFNGNVGSTFGMNGGSLEIQGNFVDNGTAQFNNGFVTVDATGLLRFGSTIATVGSAITNNGILSALAANVSFNSALENYGNFTVNPSQFVNVPANMGNYGQLTVSAAGLLSIGSFTGSEQIGNIFLNGGGILSVGSFWYNGGAVEFSQGGELAGAGMYNANLLEGSGVINVPVENGYGGTIRADNGLLVIQNPNVLNDPGAFLEAPVGGTLRFTGNLINQGVINPQGGVIDFQSNTLTNQGTMTGFGSYLAGQIVNQGSANFQGGPLTIEATYINDGGSTTEVSYATASFFGAVTNNAGGYFKNTASQMTFYSSFFNNGSYVSDPATNVFTASMALGPDGTLGGGKGNLFVMQGDLTSANPNGLQIDGATLEFTSGAHNFTLTGTAYLGALQVDTGGTLMFSGANLYVAVFDAALSQITTADTIYYIPADNPALSGLTYILSGGGLLEAVPEPGTWVLVLVGVAALLRNAAPRKRC